MAAEEEYQRTGFEGKDLKAEIEKLNSKITASRKFMEEKDKEKYGWQVYNSILNLQMLDANENESKNAKPLEKWVSEQTRNKDMRKFMEDHLIPDTDLSLSNFSDFIEKRKAMLVQRIRKMIN